MRLTMESLNNTRKQLDELEAKVKSLTVALDKLKGASDGDTELISYFNSLVKLNAFTLTECVKLALGNDLRFAVFLFPTANSGVGDAEFFCKSLLCQ